MVKAESSSLFTPILIVFGFERLIFYVSLDSLNLINCADYKDSSYEMCIITICPWNFKCGKIGT